MLETIQEVHSCSYTWHETRRQWRHSTRSRCLFLQEFSLEYVQLLIPNMCPCKASLMVWILCNKMLATAAKGFAVPIDLRIKSQHFLFSQFIKIIFDVNLKRICGRMEIFHINYIIELRGAVEFQSYEGDNFLCFVLIKSYTS